MRYKPTDNEHCPRFVAYSGPDTYVDAADDLEELLAILRQLADPDEPEDVAVWENDCRLVAVVLGDGHVVRFDDRKQAAPRPNHRANGRTRRKATTRSRDEAFTPNPSPKTGDEHERAERSDHDHQRSRQQRSRRGQGVCDPR
jgi:hypothetical protein